MPDRQAPELRSEWGESLARQDYKRDFRERDAQVRGRDSWKLERRQHFEEQSSPSWEAVLRGDWDEALRLLENRREALLEIGREDEERQSFFHRVRVVEKPLTAYLQWELHSLRIRAECGERISIVNAEALADSEEFGPLPEIVILGGRTLYQVLYSATGIPIGAIRYTDPDIVLRWENYIEDLHRTGEDVLTYFDREVARLPPPTQKRSNVADAHSGSSGGPGSTRSALSGSSAHDVVQARDISGGVHFHSTADRENATPTPRQLPADVRGFVNRVDELRLLDAILTEESKDPADAHVFVIAGTAGAGKTSLALHWAHQARSRFPDGQLYVNLRGYDPGRPVTAQEALHRFLTSLGVHTQSLPQDPDAAAALYRSLLAERRVLIVLDNAATVSQVRPLLPGSAGSLVVVTSRSRLAVRDGARRLTLGTLPEPEAVALLRTVTAGHRPQDDPAQLTELARLCAQLPLALRIAAERAASLPHMGLDDLISDLRDESALWDALSVGDDEDADAVRTVFAWSYRALPDQVARLFRLLGLHPGPDFGLHAATAIAHLTTSRTRQLLDSLVGAHLVEQTAPDRYQFHDLLRAYATDQAQNEEPPAERQAALRRALCWYLHTADAAQPWLRPAEARLPLAPLPDGVQALAFTDYNAAVDWAERERANLLQAVRTASTAGEDHLTWQLAAVLWNAQAPSAPGTDWLPAGKIGLAAAQRLGNDTAQALLLTDLGMGHTRTNSLDESLEHHRKALAIWRDLGDRLNEAHSLNLLGLAHLHKRQLGDAAKYFEKALAGFRLQGEHHWEATTLANLASAHHRAGRAQQATAAVHQALEAHRTSDNQRGEGNALRLLSDLQREEGDRVGALTSAQAALDIALSLRDHRLEGFWLLTLGDAQRANGHHTDALDSYQRAAVLHRRLGDRSREALSWHGTGETYRHLDRHTEASAFLRQAATAHHELGDTWHEALALDALSAALLTENPRTARRHREDALALLAGYDDPRAVATRDRIERELETDRPTTFMRPTPADAGRTVSPTTGPPQASDDPRGGGEERPYPSAQGGGDHG
ncbi:tetratricopeptide (TPR) repeat protein [Kitasatospora sp. MAA19]|uniref:ATP-binding protein n=1 Tax=Kitasatospora sp. MAA19 TaxID=3035090 RepID=UPI00247B493A|nr:tetratricopeptide (TPR) repeat protein [Kitasatospora sp. MAA19]